MINKRPALYICVSTLEQAQIIEGKWLVAGEKAYYKWKKDKSASGHALLQILD